jgi:N-acetylglucosaminyldiphosphoundecaprenol N-acetyl-beta-D-mannosaminyltransferase
MNFASAPFLADATLPRRTPSAAANSQPNSLAAWPIAILGVPFDHVTLAEAVQGIEAMIASGRPHYLVTANVDFLVQASQDVELRRILLEADLVLCDGTPLLWASHWLGNPLPERVAGSDLAPVLLRHAAAAGRRPFFLGAAPGVAAEAAARAERQFPGLQIAGHYAPPFAALLDMDHAEIVRRIREAKPDILFVSFGCPKQEKWIAMHYRELGVPVVIGVGATLDFLAGRMKRAPNWMRRCGAEWLFRLAQEPRRLFGRYANDLFRFVPSLATQWWQLNQSTHAPESPHVVSVATPQWYGIDAGPRLTRHALERHAAFWRETCHGKAHCLVDVSRVTSIDGTGIAFLVRWRKLQRAHGRQLVLLAPSAAMRRALRAMQLTEFFLTARDAAEATRLAEASHITVQQKGTTRSLAWCGAIVAANVEDVRRLTTDHLTMFAAQHATLVFIDLNRVRFIDSAGAALMLRLKRSARESSLEVIFAHAQPDVRNVLRLAKLDQLVLEGGQ